MVSISILKYSVFKTYNVKRKKSIIIFTLIDQNIEYLKDGLDKNNLSSLLSLSSHLKLNWWSEIYFQ